ncbi:hypothetical protein Tco_0985380 [Tanacetum coccineum]
MAVSRYMGFDSAGFALAPYGSYWREIQKLATLELFTSQGLEKVKNVRNSEENDFPMDVVTKVIMKACRACESYEASSERA